jgi:hypothetical protein
MIPSDDSFRPGVLTKDGFLGSDGRPVDKIVEDDGRVLLEFGLDLETVADRLQSFIDEAQKQLEGLVHSGGFRFRIQWDRGMIPCPFGEPGLHPKIVARVLSESSGCEIRFSRLSIHLIRKHGFFGGKGSIFRLEPEDLARHFIIQR